jgi:hypothetical protein
MANENDGSVLYANAFEHAITDEWEDPVAYACGAHS